MALWRTRRSSNADEAHAIGLATRWTASDRKHQFRSQTVLQMSTKDVYGGCRGRRRMKASLRDVAVVVRTADWSCKNECVPRAYVSPVRRPHDVGVCFRQRRRHTILEVITHASESNQRLNYECTADRDAARPSAALRFPPEHGGQLGWRRSREQLTHHRIINTRRSIRIKPVLSAHIRSRCLARRTYCRHHPTSIIRHPSRC